MPGHTAGHLRVPEVDGAGDPVAGAVGDRTGKERGPLALSDASPRRHDESMNMISTNTSLAELVTSHPSLARELERLGMDYCCGGRQTLHAACSRAGLDPEQVTVDLQMAIGPELEPDWSTMGVVELVDHLESTHHRSLWAEMPRLTALLDKIVGVHGERHPELQPIRECYADVRADLEPHMLKEEHVLFPMIREMAGADVMPSFHCGSVGNPISVMLSEHGRVGELLTRLRELTRGYEPPLDGCASYKACFTALADLEADTHLHIHKENNLLFPAVDRLEQQLSALS